ncbi:MAG: hypothetical protein R3A79_14005 [Nannocystaceae bacterium]
MSGAEPGEALAVAEAGELELTAPRPLTPAYVGGAIAAVVLLGGTTIAWLVGLVAAIAALIGGGELVPLLTMAATAWLVARGWTALYQSVAARLRPTDLSETALLPDAYWTLAPQLRRLVLDTRTSREALRDPELTRAELLRELFAWVTCIAEVEGPDRDTLHDHHLDAKRLRDEITAFYDRPDLRTRALELLDRFESQLLDRGRDPFR